MAIESPKDLTIVQYGHPALRQSAAPVRRVTGDVEALVVRMVELMRAARGIGLAANQVGIPRRIAVVEIDEVPTALVDPEIVSAEGQELAEEGCLSLPRLYGDVTRPTRVVVRARNLGGKRLRVTAEGLLARALCHEVDHLNGRLFIDSVDEETLHWLVGHTDAGEPVTQPTTLDDALRVFAVARGRER
jgi:peptide deformylase